MIGTSRCRVSYHILKNRSNNVGCRAISMGRVELMHSCREKHVGWNAPESLSIGWACNHASWYYYDEIDQVSVTRVERLS